MVKYIAVAGNMGSGESSLVRFLCRRYPHIRPFYERNEENPYLADFYRDMGRWAFHSQVYFLTLKFRTHQELDACPHTVIQDRTIYEDAEVFAENLHRRGFLAGRDYEAYRRLYDTIAASINPPDLLVYLKSGLRTIGGNRMPKIRHNAEFWLAFGHEITIRATAEHDEGMEHALECRDALQGAA